MRHRKEKLADIFYQVWFNVSCARAIRHIKKRMPKNDRWFRHVSICRDFLSILYLESSHKFKETMIGVS